MTAGGREMMTMSIRVAFIRPIVLLIGAILFFATIVANAQLDDDDYQSSPYMDNVAPILPDQLALWQTVPYDANFANDQAMGIHWSYVTVVWSDIEQVPGV